MTSTNRYRAKPIWKHPKTWVYSFLAFTAIIGLPLAARILMFMPGREAAAADMFVVTILHGLVAGPFTLHVAMSWLGINTFVAITPEALHFRYGLISKKLPWQNILRIKHMEPTTLRAHDDYLVIDLPDGKTTRVGIDWWLEQECHWMTDLTASLWRSPAGRNNPSLPRTLESIFGSPASQRAAAPRDLTRFKHNHGEATIRDDRGAGSRVGVIMVLVAAELSFAWRAITMPEHPSVAVAMLIAGVTLLAGFRNQLAYQLNRWKLDIDEDGFAFRMGWSKPGYSWSDIELLDIAAIPGKSISIRVNGSEIEVLDRASDRSWVQWLVREAELHGVPVTERARTAA